MNSTNQVSAFILAGGESSRMGRDKAQLELGGVPLILRIARLIESAAVAPAIIGNPDAYRSLSLRAIADDWPGAGPLGGIATALRSAVAPWSLIVATDLPYLTREWLEYLVARGVASQADAVVPMNTHGSEPLCAMYHQRAEPLIRGALERGTRKVTDGLLVIQVEAIATAEWKGFDSEGFLFKNMNSPQDYEEAKARLAG
ncbi:MAG TPA: molybdenum cofactor guanylyltransferase [Candidatus Acidoferrales bacterium]|jgi:molybdopterin-guanine dinucleotide biosynthesis protein A|nr:molybdenum cofactor guanylyltransferase [Candidatus Acidoferrales bacterium]